MSYCRFNAFLLVGLCQNTWSYGAFIVEGSLHTMFQKRYCYMHKLTHAIQLQMAAAAATVNNAIH